MYRTQGLRWPACPSQACSQGLFCTCKTPRRAGARPQRLPFADSRVAAAATETPALPNTDTSPFWNSIAPGPLKSADFSKFVQFFRQASSYIEGHRGRTFVIVVPGEVVDEHELLERQMADIALLHGLGVRLVLVIGCRQQVNDLLEEQGVHAQHACGYRVTDAVAMQAVVQAAGSSRMEVEARLSKGPAIQMVRRHSRSTDAFHFGPALQTVSGNWVAGKRRGVIDGIDFGLTGTVRFVQVEAIKRQLDANHIVLLSNLAYSAAGEVLNCDIYSVATRAAVDLQGFTRYRLHGGGAVTTNAPVPACRGGLHLFGDAGATAVDLQADKLFCITTPSLQPYELPHWVPLHDSEALLKSLLEQKAAPRADVPALAGPVALGSSPALSNGHSNGNGHVSLGGARASAPVPEAGHTSAGRYTTFCTPTSDTGSSSESGGGPVDIDFDKWQSTGIPLPLIAACAACQNGVKRAHLVDAQMDGSLLLELYSRDGVGVMLSADFYEGIRGALPQDLRSIEALLKPLEEKGILAPRSRPQLIQDLPHFRVAERDGKVLGCAMVKPLGRDAEGNKVSELAAFCIHPSYRGSGRGDSMLDYLEHEAKHNGVDRLVLLTTRTADWFEQRGFKPAGAAHESAILPDSRRDKVNPARNSRLYAKSLEELEENEPSPLYSHRKVKD